MSALQIKHELKRDSQYLVARPHLLIAYKMLIVCALVWALAPIALIVYRISLGQLQSMGLILFLGSICPILFLAQAYFLVRPQAQLKVMLSEESLILQTLKTSKLIEFSKIKKVEFSHVSYWGGYFFLVMNAREKYKLSTSLQGSELILEAIARSSPESIELDKVRKYRTFAILCDHFWIRTFEKLIAWKNHFYFLLGSSIAVSIILYLRSITLNSAVMTVSSVFLIHFCFAMCLWQLSEYMIALNMKNILSTDVLEAQRNLMFEAKVKKIGSIAYMLFISGWNLSLF